MALTPVQAEMSLSLGLVLLSLNMLLTITPNRLKRQPKTLCALQKPPIEHPPKQFRNGFLRENSVSFCILDFIQLKAGTNKIR